MKKLAFILISTFLLFARNAYSFEQTNLNIDSLGSESGNVFYITVKEPLQTDCLYGILYCSALDNNCKNFYSLVLAAKMANKPLSNVRYSQDSNKTCTVYGVRIN